MVVKQQLSILVLPKWKKADSKSEAPGHGFDDCLISATTSKMRLALTSQILERIPFPATYTRTKGLNLAFLKVTPGTLLVKKVGEK